MSDTPTETPDEPRIDYPALLRQALLDVPRRALRLASEQGLPGEHHFYLTFRTDHPDVEVPPRVRQQYPEEITIVLQHQFWNLVVEDARFSVTLRFGGAHQSLVVPFDALTAFVDPSVPFGLRFGAEPGDEEPSPSPQGARSSQNGTRAKGAGDVGSEPAATVVDLASFRKERGDEGE